MVKEPEQTGKQEQPDWADEEWSFRIRYSLELLGESFRKLLAAWEASIRAGAEELKAQQMARELRYQQWKKTQQIQTEETPDA